MKKLKAFFSQSPNSEKLNHLVTIAIIGLLSLRLLVGGPKPVSLKYQSS